MDDFLPNQTLSQCVIALIDRVHKLEKQEALFQALATDRPDLTEDLRRLRGKGASST
jgi:hypothetical protein